MFLDNYHKKSLLITLLQQLQTVQDKVIQSMSESAKKAKEIVDEPAFFKFKKVSSAPKIQPIPSVLQVHEKNQLN